MTQHGEADEQIKRVGFFIKSLTEIITINNHSRVFASHQYFAIIISADEFTLKTDVGERIVSSSSVVYIGPGKTFQILGEITDKTLCIIFRSGFYEKTPQDSFFINSKIFFNSTSNFFVVPLCESCFGEKKSLSKRVEDFKLRDESLYISAAHNFIESLLLHAFQSEEEKIIIDDEKFEFVSYVNRFRVLLQRDFKEQKKVSYYAAELQVSARKLTEMSEYVSGKKAKQLIIEKVIRESENALRFSSNTISEISYNLGFNDEGNFTNFLKKHTGKIPSEMREIG
ncbi:helix-turn-helix domain-containing protein [Chryseobacterium caseinilyticum]|uniref:Helix-turn-helix domain-containing protein n=1 Tax=Chryseobacterium caseinilyticum TaxID=2771428 RepID=A0ABR8Z977_9FLAO|nr:AraC family transcriptional regulator [Chryseobacterium caseinilyticum]MBD8081777.1 helix-turn-helix domain-containing protein [Chryseobacterium caseinilyticum]